MQTQIVYQHNDFIVVSKPEGVSFHLEQDNSQSGFVQFCAEQFGYGKLWPVHRLDKMTSGLLILATSATSAAQFGVLFQQRKIEKYYLDLADRKPKKKQGWVKGDMASARRGSYKLLKTQQNPSITRFISQSIVFGNDDKLSAPTFRLFLLKP